MHNQLKKLLILLVFAGATSFSLPTYSILSLKSTRSETVGLNNPLSNAFAPTFSNCPSDINNVQPNSGDCTAVVTWVPPTAAGSGTVTLTSNYDPGDSFYPGTHRVIYRATDSSGDTSFCEFKVTVVDNQSPVITVPANIVTDVDPGSCTARVTFPYPSGSDNCPAGTGESPLEQDFTDNAGNPEDFFTKCYELIGTQVGSSGAINGSDELETLSLVNFDTREFTLPLTNFNGTGEIFFDHKITAGSPSGNIGNNARLTVSLINTSNTATIIFSENYTDENVQTEYIPIVQRGDFYVRFEFDTDQNKGDIAYLDDIYIPGFVTADESGSGLCGINSNLVLKADASGLSSGSQFPVGTTTLRYIMEDAVGNFTSSSFNVTVNNNINPPNGSDAEYCEGEPVPELSVTVGAGETADWYDTPTGGNLLQANSTTFTPPGPGTYYAVTKNITTGCTSASRTRINVNENPKPSPPSAPSPIEYCINDPATQLTATGDPGNMIFWYDAPTGGTMYPIAPTPDTSTARTTFYYVEQIDAATGCVSDRTEVVVTVYALPLAPKLTTPAEYCIDEISDELNSSVTNGTNLKWYDAASGGNEISGATRPNTATAGQQLFWVTQSATSGSANCESTRTRLTVNVNPPPAITMQPLDRSVCENGNAIFAVGASNADTFQWQLFDGSNWNDLTNTTPYSGTASNTLNITNATSFLSGNQYRALASSPAASCADAVSNSVTLTVHTAPLAPISGGDQTECEQDPIQTLTATANPPSGATVVWYDAASGGNVVVNPILDMVGTVTYYAQSNGSSNGCPSIGRTPVTLTIQSAPTAPTSGGDQIECQESPIQTLTATANAPSGATIIWYDALSGGNVVANPVLNAAGTVTYYAQSNDNGTGCPSLLRTEVSLTIQAAPSPPVNGGDRSECASNPTQTLTATATVPSGFSLTWYDAASGGNLVGSPTLNSAGTITYYAESNDDATSCKSTSRTPVILTIEAVPTAPTSGGNQTECEASPTQTMTATASAPTGATVVWYDAASGGNTVGSPTLNSIGTITYYAESRTTISGCVSDSRTPVALTMNARPTIAFTPASESCSADLSTYSVSVDVNRGTVTSSKGTVTDNGGNNWTVTGVTSGNNITVTVTDANGCSENVAISVPDCSCPNVDAPTSSGNQTECETDPIQTLTATATPPSGASVVWYDAAMNGNVVASPALSTVGTVIYFAESVDNVNSCTSATRTPVILTIQGAPTTPSSGGDQTECEATPTQTLTATATSAVGTNVIWYDATSGGNTVANPTLNSVGTITYYAESRDNGTNCASHSRTAVTLTIEPNPATPTSGGDPTECETTPIQTLTATATAPSGASVVWYDAAFGGSTVAGPTLNTVGTITYYAESQNSTTSCTSTTRTPVTLTIQNTPTIALTPSSTNCSSDLTTYSVSVDVNGGTVTSTEGTVTDNGGNNWTVSGITSGKDITVTVTAANSCSDALSITAPDCSCSVVNAPISGGDQTECEESPIQTLTATATPPTDATVVWYDASSGGNVVASPTLNTVGTVTYFAESIENVTNCLSDTRTSVTLTIQATPAAPTSDGNQTECEQNPIQTLTATATAPTGSSVIWYDAASGGNMVGSPTLNAVGTVTYYAESSNNTTSCASFTRTSVTLIIKDTPVITVAEGPTCAPDLLTYEVSVNVSEGTVTTTEGTVVDNGGNNWTISGVPSGNNITLTVTASNACVATLAVTAPDCSCPVVNTPTSGGDQTECEESPIQTLTATATPPADATVVWFDAASGGNSVTNPELNTLGTVTYYAESRRNVTNCPSSTRTPVTLTIQATPADPVSGGDQTECDIDPTQALTATATSATGTSVIWYDTALGGNLVANPILNTVGSVTYFAESQDNITSCTSFNRIPVTLTIHALPNVVANATATNVNAGDPVTLTGSGADSYVWDNGVSDGDTVSPLTTTTYTAIGTDANGCENTDSITIIVGATSDIRLEKTVDNAFPNVGDTVIFTLTATNDGPSDDAGGSIINDVLPIGYTYTADTGNIANGTYNTVSGNWTLPALINGSTVSIDISAIVNAPTGTPNEYNNVAQVTSATNFDNDSTPNNDDGDQSEDDESAVSITPQLTDLEVVNTVTPDSGNPGDTLTFTVEIINNGPDNATNVSIENSVPAGFTINTVNNGGTLFGNTISWNGLNIPNGTSEILTFEVSINVPTNTPGEYTNTVQVVDVDQMDPDSTPNNDDGDQSEDDEDRAEIVLIPADLSLTKTLSAASDQNPNAGDTVTFELTLTNAGPGLATNVTIEDQVPSGFVVGAIQNGGVQNGNTITWTIPSISVGANVLVYEATLNVPANVLGEYTNTAQVTTSDQFDPDSTPDNDDGDQSEDDEARYTIDAPTVDIEITKTVDKLQTFYGDTLVFTVTAANNSTYDATNIGIEDVLPSGYALVSHNADAGAYNESTATWQIASIAIGEKVTLEMTVTVTQTDDYTNIAELIYVDQIDPNIANDRAEATPEVTQTGCLTVFNEFSPNDDGANDFFFIECIENYPNSLLQIYNRWGNEVFAARGYDNSWDGTSVSRSTIGASEKLPVGTYYYTLEPGDGNAQAKSGWLYISR